MTDPLKELNQQIDKMVIEKYVGTDYTNSYISFLDILGMKELVNRSYTDLRTIFNAVESGRELYSQIKVSGGVNTQMIIQNYGKFIKGEHLKLDRSLKLFTDNSTDSKSESA